MSTFSPVHGPREFSKALLTVSWEALWVIAAILRHFLATSPLTLTLQGRHTGFESNFHLGWISFSKLIVLPWWTIPVLLVDKNISCFDTFLREKTIKAETCSKLTECLFQASWTHLRPSSALSPALSLVAGRFPPQMPYISMFSYTSSDHRTESIKASSSFLLPLIITTVRRVFILSVFSHQHVQTRALYTCCLPCIAQTRHLGNT